MRLRHATTEAIIGEDEWNESHVLAAYDLGEIPSAANISLENGSVQTGTITTNVTLALPSVAAGTTEHLTLILTNDSTGGRAISVDGAQWVGGEAPEFNDTANAKNIIVLRGTSAGWIGDGGVVA